MELYTGDWLIRNALKLVFNRLIPLLLTLMGLLGLWHLGQTLEVHARDTLMRWTAQPAHDSPVTLILIDDESVQRMKERFGFPPWPKNHYVEIFQRLGKYKPAVMGLDSYFTSLDATSDAAVFKTMQAFPNLILGLAMTENHPFKIDLPVFYRLNLGVVNIVPDNDGIIRNIRPIQQDRQGVFPSLSLATAFEYLNYQSMSGQSKLGSWLINFTEESEKNAYLSLIPETDPEQTRKLPLDQNGAFYIRWNKLLPTTIAGLTNKETLQRSHPAIPLWKFFEDNALSEKEKQEIKGKILLVGGASSLERNYQPSPLSAWHLETDIHATAIDNILTSEALFSIPAWQQWLYLLVFCVPVFIFRTRAREVTLAVMFTAMMMFVYLTAAFLEFHFNNRILNIVTPEMFIMVAFLLGSVTREYSRGRQLKLLERNMSQLVSDQVFREIKRLDYVLEPGGKRMEITSVFVDMRNFTATAEYLPTSEVTVLLNDFYTVVEEVIFAHRGTIDKFMGDGILIIFGAPLATETHASDAFNAGREILAATRKLSVRWKEEKHITVEFGLTVNSGYAFVGFLGPQHKLEYTAVGDTVNLCVRLQEHSKKFNTRMIISEFTYDLLAPEVGEASLEELGEVTVRGREMPLKIYHLKKQD